MDIYEQALEGVLANIAGELLLPTTASELSAKDLAKIESHAKRYGHTVEEVTDAVLENAVAYRAIVGRNPGRMDYFEETLAQYLRSLEQVKSVTKLAKGGKNAVHVSQGEILVGGGKRNYIKSLDLEVEFKNGRKVYVIHKYTKQGGGSQDGAMRDALLTLGQRKSEDGTKVVDLVACLDGAFYQLKQKNGRSRMDQAHLDYPDAIICTYDTFSEATRTIWES